MVYSKRRNNLGGRRKRSNRRSYDSKRLHMIGGKPIALKMRICDKSIDGGCQDFECNNLIERTFWNGNENETYYICLSLNNDKYPTIFAPNNVYTIDEFNKFKKIGTYVGTSLYYS